MANTERDVTKINKDGTTETVVMTDEMKRKARAEKKARFAKLLERGSSMDMLDVDVGPDLHAEWVHKDDLERNQALGFRTATREDVKNKRNPSVHSDGDSKIIVGDTVLMVCDKEDHEIRKEIEQDKFNRANNIKAGKQAEEKDYSAKLNDPQYVAPLAESKVQEARKEEIERQIAIANSGNSPVLPASVLK